jgi:hypothetical protein
VGDGDNRWPQHAQIQLPLEQAYRHGDLDDVGPQLGKGAEARGDPLYVGAHQRYGIGFFDSGGPMLTVWE